MKTLQQTQTDSVSQFIDAICAGMARIMEAGEIAARAIRENPDWVDQVCARCPDLTPGFVRRIEAVGLKRLHPQLMLSEAPGVKKLAKLPYALQERYAKEPVTLLVRTATGWDTLQADIRSLTAEQANQIFAATSVRTEAEQRLWLENEAAKKAAPEVEVISPYKIVGNKIRFSKDSTWSKRELANLLVRLMD